MYWSEEGNAVEILARAPVVEKLRLRGASCGRYCRAPNMAYNKVRFYVLTSNYFTLYNVFTFFVTFTTAIMHTLQYGLDRNLDLPLMSTTLGPFFYDRGFRLSLFVTLVSEWWFTMSLSFVCHDCDVRGAHETPTKCGIAIKLRMRWPLKNQ